MGGRERRGLRACARGSISGWITDSKHGKEENKHLMGLMGGAKHLVA